MSNKRSTIYKGFIVIEDDKKKILKSKKANYIFNKKTGEMITWGKTKKSEAKKFPAPIALEMKVVSEDKIMTFLKFKKIFDKLPRSITQINFDIETSSEDNLVIKQIMQYAKKHGIIPNIKIAEEIKTEIKITQKFFKKEKENKDAKWIKTTKAQMNKDTEKFEYKIEEVKKEENKTLLNEDTLDNSYINCDGFFFPNKSLENTESWKIGIDVKICKDFITMVWNHNKVKKFRMNNNKGA